MSPQIASPVPLGDGQLATNKRDGNIINKTSSGLAGHTDTQTPTLPLTRRSTTRISLNGKEKDAKGPSITMATSTTSASSALDPLSNQIFLRTNSGTDTSLAHRLRNTTTRPDTPPTDSFPKQSTESQTRNGLLDISRDRSRKASSFLSRLAMRGAFKKQDDMPDTDSEIGDLRSHRNSLPASLSVTSDGAGFIPLYKDPPRYVRVKPYNTKQRHFHRLFLAQELSCTKPSDADEQPMRRAPATAVGTRLLKAGDAIWAAEFSVDGRYLAVAGKDQIVRVFAVISTPEERRAEEADDGSEKDYVGRSRDKLSAPVFRSKPVREFEAHTGEVLSLCWSKNNFLLSTSMDKTVRLWHVSRSECLATFKHHDLVTSIAFHPKDDRFFLAGSLDSHLRLWSIPDKAVAYSTSVNEFITAVAFTPDGKTAICGVLSGMCWFFDTDGLKPQFQIHVRSSRGRNARGSKITGIKTAMFPPDAEDGEVKVLISSNDSRIRIYNLKTKMLEVKYKGLENQSSQIHARFSDDGDYVICGSEDRRAYIWKPSSADAEFRDKQPYECFDAHPEVVTTALMAPKRTKQALSASGDPIFDLCNPPPVLLRSSDETMTSQTDVSDGEQTETATSSVTKPEENPGYVKRCNHPDGNIIVTTDRTGTIKVFRQDCAYKKRQQFQWELSSKFSGRMSGLGRSGSIITRASGGSRRTSMSLGSQAQQNSDRIMSWRDDVDEGGRSSMRSTPSKTTRSISPEKPKSPVRIISRSVPPESQARNQAHRAPAPPPIIPPKPVSRTNSEQTGVSLSTSQVTSPGPSSPPTPSFSFVSANNSGETGSFWNFSRWKGISGLRYSMSALPINENDSSQTNGEKTHEKGNSRKSMNAVDVSRLMVVDDGKRRKSMDPLIELKAQERVSMQTIAEKAGERRTNRDQSPFKKRTDSGVGRLSAESGEPV